MVREDDQLAMCQLHCWSMMIILHLKLQLERKVLKSEKDLLTKWKMIPLKTCKFRMIFIVFLLIFYQILLLNIFLFI